ncbi:MAG: hypothetical protein OXC19_13695 [Bryobacterales bacterium]|nr:hypothetical protein [Bryobacterales bacterium]
MRLWWLLRLPALVGLLTVLAASATAIEIATGSMLGPRYQQDRFYVRGGPTSSWGLTYGGGSFKRNVRGSLALVRVPHAIFDDEWLRERQFDPDRNTDRLIEQLDLYRRHGVGGLVVSLQGGDPGYSAEANGVTRGRSADLGEGAGALVSAYEPDGSLKPAWLDRLDRLIGATNSRGMVVCLVLFQQDQDEALESPEAILAAARNVARHLIERDARNVIIDLADAWDEPQGRWDHRRFVPRYVEHLIRTVREEFQDSDFTPPIGASSGSGMLYPLSLAQLCDVVLLQGDGRSAADKLARSRQFKRYERPVLMVSDRNGVQAKRSELEAEGSIAEAYIRGASGWSYVPSGTVNVFPFIYHLPETSAVEDSWPDARRFPAYFRAMLERIARIVLRKPPSTSGEGKR